MFLRIKKFGRNKQRRYYYIVEAVKVKGKPKQKVIKYLGTIQNIVGIAERYGKSKE